MSSIISHPGASNVTGKAGASTRPGVPPGSPSVPTVSSPVPRSSGEESPPVVPHNQKKKKREKRHQCSTCGKMKASSTRKGIRNSKPCHGGPSATSTPRAPAALPGRVIPRRRTRERRDSTKSSPAKIRKI